MSIISDIMLFGAYFVVMGLSMWLTAKVLKFKKQDIKHAAFFALVYVVVFSILGSLLLPNASEFTPEKDFVIQGYIFWALLILAWVLSIKVFYKEGWLKTIAAFIITLVIMSALSWVLIGQLYQMGLWG